MSDSIKTFKAGYILLPVLIGLSVVGWLFYREFNPELFSDIHFSWRLVGGLLLAILFMFGRDGGLMWRFRFITDRELTWRQAFRVNMLCEFTSAVTPSAVGGSSLIVLFLNKEGINAGRSTALTISRYLVVNALLIAFTTSGSQLLAFVRQLILWVVMTISPTPGGSGVSEYMFREYYTDFFDVAGMALVVAFVWRIITYYMYLLIGAIIIPGWVKKLRD